MLQSQRWNKETYPKTGRAPPSWDGPSMSFGSDGWKGIKRQRVRCRSKECMPQEGDQTGLTFIGQLIAPMWYGTSPHSEVISSRKDWNWWWFNPLPDIKFTVFGVMAKSSNSELLTLTQPGETLSPVSLVPCWVMLIIYKLNYCLDTTCSCAWNSLLVPNRLVTKLALRPTS